MVQSNNFADVFPELAKEWHPKKNGGLLPSDVAPMSSQKVWWLGKCGHEWDAVVSSRSKGHGCPYCNNLKALSGFNDLKTINPKLAEEWDYKKNGDLKPSDVLPGSNKEVWWICKRNHSWRKKVKDRNSGNNCPYCSNQRVLAGYNDLATTNPELAKEWDYEKNGDLTPDKVFAGAEKKVWWICKKGHSWEAYIFNRKKGVGCPYCSGKKALFGFNDLETNNPKLAKEWDYNKNGDLKPSDVTYGSHKEVWWICKNNHSWKSKVKDRNNGNNCPYCANKRVLEGYNDFETVYPDLAKEWSKKNNILPREIIRGSDKKRYWICPIGHDDYLMTIDQRIMGQGCPKCAQQSQTSFPEQSLYFYIRQVFPDAINRYQVEKKEIDIYIPSEKIGIEYNGYFSHKGKENKDEKKSTFFKDKGIKIIRIKEYKRDEEQINADYYIHERTTYQSISYLISQVLLQLKKDNILDVDCEKDQIAIKEQYINSLKDNSIVTIKPELISEWDYNKNGNIKPEFVSCNSKSTYFWICRICGYSYRSSPASRNRGTGCPACAGKAVNPGFNDLATRKPQLLKEWDYKKNNDTNPSAIFYHSKKVVWWKCNRGHSWEKSIYSRSCNNSKCPYCTGRSVITGYNDLLTQKPELAKEWDYELNKITPDKIHYNNQTYQAHWVCSKCGYKWVYRVSSRNRCPECQRQNTLINVYNASDLSFLGQFANTRCLCDYLGLDYDAHQRSISNVCRRVRKTFVGKYILRYAKDDEFANNSDNS